MTITKNDYGSLIAHLGIVADREFTDKQSEGLVAAFRSLGWEGSYRVVEGIAASTNIPRNLYGTILNSIKEEQRYQAKQKFNREHWKVADEDKASEEEFCITMRVIGLICRFENSADLLFKFGDFMEKAVTQSNFMAQMKRAEEFYGNQIKAGARLKTISAGEFL